MNITRAARQLFTPPSAREEYQRAPVVGPQVTSNTRGIRGSIPSEYSPELAISKAYLLNSYLYRAVNIIADDIASLPFRAGPDPSEANDFNIESPLARLLGPAPGGPNADCTPVELWTHAIASYIIQGQFAWELELSNAGKPVAIWPLMAQYLRAIPWVPENGGTPRYFASYEYSPNGKSTTALTDAQVYYQWQPSQKSWHQPQSALQAARLDIEVAVMQDVYDHAFLRNDARPASVVAVREFQDDGEYEAFKERLNGSFRGPQNAGKQLIMEATSEESSVGDIIDVKTLGLSQRDAEFIKRYEQKLRGIVAAIGVPMSKIDASGRTFDNASEENKTYWLQTIKPLARRLADRINLRLAPRLGTDVGWFDFSEVEALQPPQKFVLVSPIDAYNNRIITLDEARGALGHDAIDSDELAELIADVPTVEPAVASADDQEDQDMPDDEAPDLSNQQLQRIIDGIAEAISSREPTREVDHVARRDAQWHKIDKQISSMEEVWLRAFKRLFRKQEEATIKRLEGKRGRQAMNRQDENGLPSPDASGVFDTETWKQETEDMASGLYASVSALAIAETVGTLGIGFDIKNPLVDEFISARALDMAGLVTQTTYAAIRQEMIEGVAAGEGIPEIAKRIRGVFDNASRNRSVTIARTEVISAYNGSMDAIGRALPRDVVGAKEWIATRDGRTREAHANADGQVADIGGAFQVGGYSMEYPGDYRAPAELTVNCRCAVGLLTPDSLTPDQLAALGRNMEQGKWRSVESVTAELVRIAAGAAA